MTKRVFFLGAGFSKAIDKRYKDLIGLSAEIENRIKNKKDCMFIIKMRYRELLREI